VWTESNVFAAIQFYCEKKTGGLKDTVIDFGDNGISHDQSSVGDICYSIQRAINLYKDKEHLNAIRNTGMNTDHSWEKHVKNI
jgi:starch synthase